MPLVVIKGRQKDHVAQTYTDGVIRTVCGQEMSENSTIIESAPRYDFCSKCYQWIGKQMEVEFMGTDSYGEYKTSIIKHRKRSL